VLFGDFRCTQCRWLPRERTGTSDLIDPPGAYRSNEHACCRCRTSKSEKILNDSLSGKIPQQVHSRGQVIVSGDGVYLPLAQLRERLGLDPLRASVCAVRGQHVVGKFGRPFEFVGSQCFPSACQHLLGATNQADQLCCAILLRKGTEISQLYSRGESGRLPRFKNDGRPSYEEHQLWNPMSSGAGKREGCNA
jgi:hypothetical protein